MQASVHAFAPDISVVFDPASLPPEARDALPGLTLGVLVASPPREDDAGRAGVLDRLICFDPALTGATVSGTTVWRAVPPPVSDRLFAEVRPPSRAPRTMTVGHSTDHREAMLMPAKHRHDLLQVPDGVGGAALAELFGEYDVGVYVPPDPGGGFGWQVGAHLAAGHLLLSEPISPEHGLERDIDYWEFGSAGALVWALERLSRFPEMYQRTRVRGHLKAEQYRASRIFARIIHDLVADVTAFG
jgi:hypothetical protein